MKQTMRLSAALFASCFVALSHAGGESRYIFSTWAMPAVGWESKYSFEFVYSDEALSMRVGSKAGWVSYCDEDTGFYCLEAHEFNFALPRSGFEIGDTWEWSGRDYEAAAEFEISAFGVSIQVVQIDAAGGGGPNIFYYSNIAGLVGFGFLGSTPKGDISTEFYLLEGYPGLLLEPPF